jgi:elongation factor Ts
MSITAAQVKELRERTGAGMMECKKALVETGGDMDAAIELMRKQGLAKADKKADRVAAEGRIVMASSDDGSTLAMVEINCETDFVAGGDDLIGFGDKVAQVILSQDPADLDALASASIDGGDSVDQTRREMIARIGENISVRRFQRMATDGGVLGSYKHGDRIGVVVELSGGDDDLARDLAMHVAASKPVCVDSDQVPAETMEQERSILVAQAQDSGKPAEIIEKMVEGRIRKWLAEITLVGQPFVKDPDITVGKLIGQADAKVVRFARMEVGEGIEKKEEDFVAEVRAQAEGR